MRGDSFTFKCNKDERRMIALLAERLQRPQSDAIRFVIREAVQALESDAPLSSTQAARPQHQAAQP